VPGDIPQLRSPNTQTTPTSIALCFANKSEIMSFKNLDLQVTQQDIIIACVTISSRRLSSYAELASVMGATGAGKSSVSMNFSLK